MTSSKEENKYLFISRKSSHFRYYQKLVSFLGGAAELQTIKMTAFPRLSYWHHVSKLDVDDLVAVHLSRKLVRHPSLLNIGFVYRAFKALYVLIEKCRASYYFKLFLNSEHQTVIVWNGMKQPNKTPYQVAKACGKKTMLFENGLLPNTTVLDPKGVNALNSMPRDPHFYLQGDFAESELKKDLVVRAPHKLRKVTDETVKLPERFIFVPFQVPNDTQIICHSPWIKSMEALYAILEYAVNKSKEQRTEKLVFVVKEHPSWPRSFTQLHFKNSQILFANNMKTQDLIEQSAAVVTINSTVGIEALLLNKKVITLGNSFYNVDGLVWHVENQHAFYQLITQVDELTIDTDLNSRFLGYLQNEYLLPEAWQNVTTSSVAHFEAVKQRLEATS